MKSYASIINRAFAGAVPDQDILALNRVIGLGIHGKISIGHINDIIRFYREAGTKRFFIQLSPHVSQQDLREMLREAGFRHHNNWVKLWRKADAPIPGFDSSLTVREISGKESGEYGHIIFSSFDWQDPRLSDWLAHTVGKSGYSHFLAFKDEKPIAAAALHIMGEYASMAFAGTLADFRRLEAQSALLKARTLKARDLGCKYIISETAIPTPEKEPESYRNMRKFGFEVAYERENWLYEF